MKTLLISFFAIALGIAAGAADEPNAEAPRPPVTIVLGPGEATAVPFRQGSARTGAGNIHVVQPAPDMISVTMTGAAAAKPHPLNGSTAGLNFDLSQCVEVVFHSPAVKGAKLIMWGRVVGLLRSDSHCCKCGGLAETSPAHASVNCGPDQMVALSLPSRTVTAGQNLSIHDRQGPIWVPVVPGKYTLHQVFGITASHGKGLCGRPASAEFAPEPALEDDWLGAREPFHGAAKEDFGFQVILKVVAEE